MTRPLPPIRNTEAQPTSAQADTSNKPHSQESLPIIPIKEQLAKQTPPPEDLHLEHLDNPTPTQQPPSPEDLRLASIDHATHAKQPTSPENLHLERLKTSTPTQQPTSLEDLHLASIDNTTHAKQPLPSKTVPLKPTERQHTPQDDTPKTSLHYLQRKNDTPPKKQLRIKQIIEQNELFKTLLTPISATQSTQNSIIAEQDKNIKDTTEQISSFSEEPQTIAQEKTKTQPVTTPESPENIDASLEELLTSPPLTNQKPKSKIRTHAQNNIFLQRIQNIIKEKEENAANKIQAAWRKHQTQQQLGQQKLIHQEEQQQRSELTQQEISQLKNLFKEIEQEQQRIQKEQKNQTQAAIQIQRAWRAQQAKKLQQQLSQTEQQQRSELTQYEISRLKDLITELEQEKQLAQQQEQQRLQQEKQLQIDNAIKNRKQHYERRQARLQSAKNIIQQQKIEDPLATQTTFTTNNLDITDVNPEESSQLTDNTTPPLEQETSPKHQTTPENVSTIFQQKAEDLLTLLQQLEQKDSTDLTKKENLKNTPKTRFHRPQEQNLPTLSAIANRKQRYERKQAGLQRQQEMQQRTEDHIVIPVATQTTSTPTNVPITDLSTEDLTQSIGDTMLPLEQKTSKHYTTPENRSNLVRQETESIFDLFEMAIGQENLENNAQASLQDAPEVGLGYGETKEELQELETEDDSFNAQELETEDDSFSQEEIAAIEQELNDLLKEDEENEEDEEDEENEEDEKSQHAKQKPIRSTQDKNKQDAPHHKGTVITDTKQTTINRKFQSKVPTTYTAEDQPSIPVATADKVTKKAKTALSPEEVERQARETKARIAERNKNAGRKHAQRMKGVVLVDKRQLDMEKFQEEAKEYLDLPTFINESGTNECDLEKNLRTKHLEEQVLARLTDIAKKTKKCRNRNKEKLQKLQKLMDFIKNNISKFQDTVPIHTSLQEYLRHKNFAEAGELLNFIKESGDETLLEEYTNFICSCGAKYTALHFASHDFQYPAFKETCISVLEQYTKLQPSLEHKNCLHRTPEYEYAKTRATCIETAERTLDLEKRMLKALQAHIKRNKPPIPIAQKKIYVNILKDFQENIAKLEKGELGEITTTTLENYFKNLQNENFSNKLHIYATVYLLLKTIQTRQTPLRKKYLSHKDAGGNNVLHYAAANIQEKLDLSKYNDIRKDLNQFFEKLYPESSFSAAEKNIYSQAADNITAINVQQILAKHKKQVTKSSKPSPS